MINGLSSRRLRCAQPIRCCTGMGFFSRRMQHWRMCSAFGWLWRTTSAKPSRRYAAGVVSTRASMIIERLPELQLRQRALSPYCGHRTSPVKRRSTLVCPLLRGYRQIDGLEVPFARRLTSSQRTLVYWVVHCHDFMFNSVECTGG